MRTLTPADKKFFDRFAVAGFGGKHNYRNVFFRRNAAQSRSRQIRTQARFDEFPDRKRIARSRRAEKFALLLFFADNFSFGFGFGNFQKFDFYWIFAVGSKTAS